MANIKSSEKDYRRSLKRQARNIHWRTTVKNALKKAKDAVAGKDPAAAKQAVLEAEVTLKKVASKGVIHKANASRHVSRLNKALANVGK
ncbi:MAG: 30S ribosomal protein S20 [Myxococcales bacterium]